MALNETEQLVVDCLRMRLTEIQSLAYLKANEHEIHRATFYRIKGRLEATKLKRLYEIAAIGFEDRHVECVDQLRLIEKLMWENYHREEQPYRKTMILKEIKELQPYLSAYYEATKELMKGRKTEGDNPIPDITREATVPE